MYKKTVLVFFATVFILTLCLPMTFAQAGAQKRRVFETNGWFNFEGAVSPGLLAFPNTSNLGKSMIGGVALPEIRLRFFSDEGVLSLFGSVGYTGLSTLFSNVTSGNTTNEGVPFKTLASTPCYALLGLAFNIHGEDNQGIKTSLKCFEIGCGYANVPIKECGESNDDFLHGMAIILAVSTHLFQIVGGKQAEE